MNCNAGEVAFAEKFVKLSSAECALDEDDDLIELQCVEEIIEFAVLLAFTENDVVLLKTVERKLRLIIDIHFQRVAHELLADWTNIL
jgi:hypothetical protein